MRSTPTTWFTSKDFGIAAGRGASGFDLLAHVGHRHETLMYFTKLGWAPAFASVCASFWGVGWPRLLWAI
eukprot:3291112-Amphidinium_carterae.2